MLSFRQKVFFSYLLTFLVFGIFLYPLTMVLVEHIYKIHLIKRVDVLVTELVKAQSEQELIETLKEREKYLFFRVTLYTPPKGYVFDSHQNVEALEFEDGRQQSVPEVEQALRHGVAYAVRYSSAFSQQVTYVARRFTVREHTYILRAAFPNEQIVNLTRDLTATFLLFVLALLLLFSAFAWFILHHLTKPVYAILNAIRPFQEGKAENIAEIAVDDQISEFGQLAATLNALSRRVNQQIASLTYEKNEKSAILESLIEGVIAVDSALTVIYMNRMAETFLDIDPKAHVGKPFAEMGPEGCEQLLKRALQSNKPVFSVLKLGRKQRRFFDLIAVPLGQGEGAILVLQDKTGLHRVIEMGRDFVANASHELKTPITIIRGFAETLHDHPTLSADIYQEITRKIVSNCTRMETLVKNLLTLATLDEGLPDSRLQQCDLVDLIEQAKQTTRVVHPQARIDIQPTGAGPLILRLDGALFSQAILNLLDNAAKYSKGAAQITVRIVKNTSEYVIQISDRGIGIPKEDLERIFERFYAVDKSHSRAMGGSGLGLSIVQQIIEKHQGKIEVDSELNKGTTFTIRLPLPSTR